MKINIPMRITIARFALLPLILFFYISGLLWTGNSFFADWGKLVALILFVIAVSTDWLDGYLARRLNQVTDAGKILDPLADKCLSILGFILIITDPIFAGSGWMEAALPYWVAVIAVFLFLARDTFVDALRAMSASKGMIIPGDALGKIQRVLIYIVIPMYFAFVWLYQSSWATIIETGNVWYDAFGYACLFVLIAAVITAVWSGVNYYVNYHKEMKAREKKALQKGEHDL